MASTVTLEITNGPLAGQKFAFAGRTHCVIGRDPDCTIAVPESYDRVSRRHCVLEINPPQVSAMDLKSLNGTHCNGECIGRREKGSSPQSPPVSATSGHPLTDQDELWLGGGRNFGACNLSLRIHVEIAVPAFTLLCAVCGNEANVPSDTPRFDRFVCTLCRDDCEAMRRHLEADDEAHTSLAAIANYQLLQKIGQGGFGAVYLARQRATNRTVALKVMLPHIAKNPTLRQVFEREIENLKALRHPHVVELFEEGCEGGICYFTMEYCARGSVSALLQERGGTLPVTEALHLIYQAIDGLHYAHHAAIPQVRLADGTYAAGRGLVHRDIKPCNLLLAQVGDRVVLKVGDYGLSKVWEQAGYSGVTRPGTKAGSFAYQPRQQVRGYRDSQPEVDVWATAATLYFLLTGATPRDFPPDIAPELVVLQQPVIKIRDRNPHIPQRLADVIDNVLVDDSPLAVKDIAAFKRSLELAS